MCIAVHGNGGLAVTRHRRRDVCIMRLFINICDDGVPEGVARDALHVHLLADVPHQRAMLGIGQGLRAAKEEVMPARCLRCRFFNVGSGNLRDSYVNLHLCRFILHFRTTNKEKHLF